MTVDRIKDAAAVFAAIVVTCAVVWWQFCCDIPGYRAERAYRRGYARCAALRHPKNLERLRVSGGCWIPGEHHDF